MIFFGSCALMINGGLKMNINKNKTECVKTDGSEHNCIKLSIGDSFHKTTRSGYNISRGRLDQKIKNLVPI